MLMLEFYKKGLDVLFSNIRLTGIEQGSKEWLDIRNNYITSSDICSIVLHLEFHQEDIYLPVSKLLEYKVNPPEISQFSKQKMRCGVVSEANIISQMQSNDSFAFVLPSQHYLSEYCSFSPDVIASKKNNEDTHIIYELKYTSSPNIFNAIKSGDNTNRYFKRYMIQLAYHMIAYHYFLKANNEKKDIIGVLMVCSDNNGKLIYAKQEINFDSIYISAICKSADKIIYALDSIRKGIEPFFNKQPSKDLSNNVSKYVRLKYEISMLELDILELMNSENINKVVSEDPIGDYFSVSSSVRNIKLKTLRNGYSKTDLDCLKKQKEEISDKILNDFYDVVEKESISITTRKVNQNKRDENARA